MSSQIESHSSFEKTAQKYKAVIRAAARKIIARCPANVEIDDLAQVGMIALWKATQTFDISLSNASSSSEDAFSAYAMQRVRGAMLDELRSMDTLSRRDRGLAKALRKAIEEAHGEELNIKRLPTHLVSMAAAKLHLSDEDAHRILLHSLGTSSIDPSLDLDGPGEAFINQASLPSSSIDMVENSADAAMWIARLPLITEKLDEREQAVLMNWLHENLEQHALGKEFHLTESRMCQIKKKVLQQLPRHAAAIVRDKAIATGQYRPPCIAETHAAGEVKVVPPTGLEWMSNLLTSHRSEDIFTVEDVGAAFLGQETFSSNDRHMAVGPGTRWG